MNVNLSGRSVVCGFAALLIVALVFAGRLETTLRPKPLTCYKEFQPTLKPE